MNSLFTTTYRILMAEAADPMSSMLTLVLPLGLMFGLMYLIIIRPQKKKEKNLKLQIDAMRVGDNVLTIGGIVGKVVNMKDDEVTISTSPANTLITFKKTAINTVQQRITD